jgi:ribosome maturation factor RimP
MTLLKIDYARDFRLLNQGIQEVGTYPPFFSGRNLLDQAELREKLEELVTGAGLILVDFSLGKAGRRIMVRLLIDREGRVTVNECAAVSKRVLDFLDSGMALGTDDYRLEVSSPGVGRALESEADWRRTAGRVLRIEFDGGSYTGLLARHEAGALVFADGTRMDTGSIVRAVEVLEEPSTRDT